MEFEKARLTLTYSSSTHIWNQLEDGKAGTGTCHWRGQGENQASGSGQPHTAWDRASTLSCSGGLSHGGHPTSPAPKGAELERGPLSVGSHAPEEGWGAGAWHLLNSKSGWWDTGWGRGGRVRGFPQTLVTALPSSSANNNDNEGDTRNKNTDLGLTTWKQEPKVWAWTRP